MVSSASGHLTDTESQPSVVVVPIELWRQIFPDEISSSEVVAKGIEAYCLTQGVISTGAIDTWEKVK